MKEIKPYLVDVPVLVVFFTRPEILEKTFQSIRQARPSKLYLCQDGPRVNREDDVINIERCRAVFEKIDWECEIYTLFSDRNLGCDLNIFNALNWVFEKEDRIIMLEDDGYVHPDFFSFCQEMFEKYKNDPRVSLISSFNLLEQWNCPYSYFFSNSGTLSGGWGMWKRAWEHRDVSLDFLNDEYTVNTIKSIFYNKNSANNYINGNLSRKKEQESLKKVTSFEVIVSTCRILQSSLTIVPRRNMMCNIGVDPNATHSGSHIKSLPRKIQKIFFMNTFPMDENIIHPPYIISDNNYYREIGKIVEPNPFIKKIRRIEGFIRRRIYK